MLTKNMSVALAGGVGLAFLGYCFYFDHKRRNHPEFRKRLIESKIKSFIFKRMLIK
jgi:import receptor subunit TOM20